uniref:Uncharacterized protein n=1 Tax=Spongospora subterranea TaxID=70186 RepID=A0A0H5QII7_9EUKA|eukprot:CRZ01885.1 hypothetical protein [Spongospora subterranea]
MKVFECDKTIVEPALKTLYRDHTHARVHVRVAGYRTCDFAAQTNSNVADFVASTTSLSRGLQLQTTALKRAVVKMYVLDIDIPVHVVSEYHFDLLIRVLFPANMILNGTKCSTSNHITCLCRWQMIPVIIQLILQD